MKLLASVDSTTRAQAILQRTVESLSVIVITYYLTGLGGYVLKACYELGWIKNANVATAIFVPIAFAISFTLMTVGRKIIVKRMANPASDPGGTDNLARVACATAGRIVFPHEPHVDEEHAVLDERFRRRLIPAGRW